MFKKITALILVFVLVVGVVPSAKAAPETIVDTGDVTIEGTNGFGDLLAQEITENQQESETESKDYLGGYSITDLEIVNNVATVTYDSLEEAILVVALHTEDRMQLITSATVTVTSDATEAVVTFESEMPEYFLASAYLLDQYDYSPLCASYDTPIYTREMQELLASTVDDYDPEKVLNLDEDKTTNFAVYADSTIVIEPEDGVNTVASIDDENATYVIKNADEQMTSLSEGDAFVYPYGENELLIVKVAGITIDGTTVTITGDEIQMTDVFDVVKVETIGNTEDFIVDESSATDGITYLGTEKRNNGDVSICAEGDFEQGTELKFGFDNVELGNGVKLSGGLASTLKFKLNYYVTWTYQEVIVSLDFGGKFDISITGKCKWCEVEMLRLALPVTWGVYIRFNPTFVVESEAKITFEVSLSQKVGFKYSSQSGFTNISSNPDVDTEFSFAGKIFIGIDFGPEIEVAGGYLMNLSASMIAGVEITGKPSGAAVGESEPDRYKHQCALCIDGDISFRLKISPSLVFLKSEKLKLELELCDTTIHLLNFYYSDDLDRYGIGICPNRSYLITFQITTREGAPVPGATIEIDGISDSLEANESGLASCYLNAGEYVVTAASNDMYCAKAVIVEAPAKIIIPLILDADGDGKDDNTGENDESSDDWWDDIDFGGITDGGNEIESGTCGENVYWTLYDTGLLVISGAGKMTDYGHCTETPWWYTYCNQINSVRIENGVTTIGSHTFDSYTNLSSIVIPDSVTTIGGNAFDYCTSLSSIVIPDSVTTIGGSAFAYCHSLSSIVIPDSVTTIGVSAFANCDSLSSIVIPDSVTTIGSYAFENCDSLSSIEIPDSVTTIAFSTFKYCDSLSSIVIPDSVTTIGSEAFEYCYSLSSIVIPDSVTTIGNFAFGSCYSLSSVTFRGDEPSIDYYAFKKCETTCYYPANNPTWIYEVMPNYGGTITWVPYTPTNTDTVIGGLRQSAAQEPVIRPQAVYGGDYNTEVTDDITIKTADFSDLVPGAEYVMLALVSMEADELLAADNLLAIDQGVAAEDGTLSFRYIQRTPCDLSYVFVCGASRKNLNDASITFPEMVADGELQVVNPTVVYDGKTLTEGRDYVITGKVDFTEAGEYTCYIRGIHNYAGLVECTYTVAEHEHSFTNYVSDGNATCTEDGTKTAKCDHCDATDTIPDAGSALGHDMGSWETAVPATCTENGEEQRTCSRCDHSECRVIEAVGHQWDKGVVVKEPTEDIEGERLYTCTACGATKTESIPVIGHEHHYEAVVTAPTCTERGYTTYTCKCGESYVADYVDALGHSFGDWTVIQEPTTTEEGLEERSCTRCGHTEQRSIAKLENPFNDVAPGSFYYDPVMWAIENGITNGTSATTFGPNDQCMRAHVVTFLWRAVGCPESTRTDNPFVDVKPGDFYYKPVLWALENGITSGMDATHFGPTAYCNRAQVVTFLYRTMGSPELESMDNPFADVQAGAFYERAVLWAVENGITNGLSATAFGPNSICNRAQIVTFLYRAFVD